MSFKSDLSTEDYDNLYDDVVEWGVARNIIGGSTSKDQLLKAQMELGELADAVCKGDSEQIEKENGDLIVVAIMIAEQNGLSLYDCLYAAYNKIKDRKGVLYNGVFIKESDKQYPEILKRIGK